MGTCCSTNRAAAAAPSRNKPSRPPPEIEAEEKVKEVLSVSETPKPNPRPSPKQFGSPDVKLKQELTATAAVKGFSGGFPVPIEDCDHWSEDASEVYIESLSASTATYTEKEKRVPPAEVEKVRRSPVVSHSESKRPVPGNFRRGNDRSVTVGRRSSPSPAKRKSDAEAIGRTDSGRELSSASRKVSSGARRETGERSGRRSASPAAKRVAAEARHDNWGAAVAPGGGAVQKGAPVASAKEESPGRADEKVGGGGEGKQEAVENPVVSLECFIFL